MLLFLLYLGKEDDDGRGKQTSKQTFSVERFMLMHDAVFLTS